MSLELLKKNIQQEKILVGRLVVLIKDLYRFPENSREKKVLNNYMQSIVKQVSILNNSIPSILNQIILIKQLPSSNINKEIKNTELLYVSHNNEGFERQVGILKKERNNYLKELDISERSLKQILKKRKEDVVELVNEYKKPRGYVRIANKLFGNSASKMVENGYFKKVSEDLRKSNFTLLTKSYIAVIFFSTFLSGFFGIGLTILFMFFGISLESPYVYLISFSEINPLERLLKVFWFIPLVPLITFLALYFYPSAEKSSLKNNLDYELPFAAIQMSAIAGSDIEPSNIFRIIALNKEYPAIRNESKKLMNQINLYGYDLTTSLKNVASISPSKDWADLLNGISTNLRSGGNLSKYLDKKAESLLFNYRLKREKATKAAETFMDIYISVVIAAPMLMMLLLIMINISNIGFNLPVPVLSTIIISIVSLIYIIFLIFLHMSQRQI